MNISSLKDTLKDLTQALERLEENPDREDVIHALQTIVRVQTLMNRDRSHEAGGKNRDQREDVADPGSRMVGIHRGVLQVAREALSLLGGPAGWELVGLTLTSKPLPHSRVFGVALAKYRNDSESHSGKIRILQLSGVPRRDPDELVLQEIHSCDDPRNALPLFEAVGRSLVGTILETSPGRR